MNSERGLSIYDSPRKYSAGAVTRENKLLKICARRCTENARLKDVEKKEVGEGPQTSEVGVAETWRRLRTRDDSK